MSFQELYLKSLNRYSLVDFGYVTAKIAEPRVSQSALGVGLEKLVTAPNLHLRNQFLSKMLPSSRASRERLENLMDAFNLARKALDDAFEFFGEADDTAVQAILTTLVGFLIFSTLPPAFLPPTSF